MVYKLTRFFFVLVLTVSFLSGLTTYVLQSKVYKEECEQDLQTMVKLLADMMQSDRREFSAYQEIILKYGDEIRIPADYDGEYRPAKVAFYKLFNETYPGKVMGKDIDYLDMTKEVQILFAIYKQEYWLHAFETTKKNFGAIYAYYVTPTGEDLNMYFVLDAVVEPFTEDGKDYISLNIEAYQDIENHSHMWKAWNTGAYTSGYDVYDNEYGQTYACYYPLIIDGTKLGVVCAEMEIGKVQKAILQNSITQFAGRFFIIAVLCTLISLTIGKRYIERLVTLKGDVVEFTKYKDPSQAQRIKTDIKGDDEITDLANQIAVMIDEIGTNMNELVAKNKELTEAQDKIKKANELASTDALTGIRNKAGYDNEIMRIEQSMIRDGYYKYGIAMVDLNYLKVINDTYGHEKGNIAIIKICNIVCKNFAHSPVFRIGGDEFVVVLENEDYDNIETLVQWFKHTLEVIAEDESLKPWEKVSAAIGWAKYDPKSDDSMETVFKRADNLMYENKKQMKAARR
ncbi:GGDEF domain-containing protein [Butyrivibrio sp. VCB2006]|uniref:GGDEF domain-containing protein n=1 Tax=Butyrivibrio sp. VCB2006 TaxID=1280679 RepID=UPI0004106343|nr:GGDEF domain-containing protein [Butyrivibrio sp. VCB2006]